MSGHTRVRAEISILSELLRQAEDRGHMCVRQMARGYVAGAMAYLEKHEGQTAAYEFVQQLADDLAARIPANKIRVQRRREKE